MKKLLLLTGFILVFIVSFSQKKWYQQKNTDFGVNTKVDGSPGTGPKDQVAFIDFDNDGLKDIIAPSFYDKVGSPDMFSLRFYKNKGNGKFAEVTNSIINPDIKSGRFLIGNGSSASVFDFNKDGKMDIIFPSGWENQNYSNNDAIFGIVKMRDYYYNNDPKTDVELRANEGFATPSFFYQTNGTFKKGYDLFDVKTYGVDGDAQHADLNNDGFEDLLIYQTGYITDGTTNIKDWLGGVTIWMNDGGKGFKFNHLKLADSINKFTFGFYDEGKMGVSDLNGDGFNDIIIYGIKAPYKARDDIRISARDSALWSENFRIEDKSRPKTFETRVYLSSKGVFSGSNYYVIPNLRALFPQGVDLNGDGKNDILAIWKNYRAGGQNGVYTDSLTNKNGINNQYYVYVNKGNNEFEDQTSKYFPSDNTKFGRLGRGDFSYTDIDGDGFKDFAPFSYGDDTLRDVYKTFAIDTAGSHASIFFKNINNQYFKKTIIDSIPKVLGWRNFPILKNVDSMYAQFYSKYYTSSELPKKAEYLLDENYFLNKLYFEDLNNDGKKEIIGLDGFNNRMTSFLYEKYGYRDSLSIQVAFSTLSQCETPQLSKSIIPICGTDTAKNVTVKILNFNKGDSVYWNYNGNVIKNTSDSVIVKEIGWLSVIKKDTAGCVSFSSDSVYIRKSPKPNIPRVYYNGPSNINPNSFCYGTTVVITADAPDTLVLGKIKWIKNGVFVNNSNSGGVSLLPEGRKITTPGKLSVDSSANIYTTFYSADGCESDTSNKFIVTSYFAPAPSISRNEFGALISTSNLGNIWYKDGSILVDSTQNNIKPSSSGSYTVKTIIDYCKSLLSNPYYYLITDIINLSTSEFIKLAPNPFIGQLNFDFKINNYQKLNIEIFEITTGNRILNLQNQLAGQTLDLNALSSGTYIIKVFSLDNKINYQFKMIKM